MKAKEKKQEVFRICESICDRLMEIGFFGWFAFCAITIKETGDTCVHLLNVRSSEANFIAISLGFGMIALSSIMIGTVVYLIKRSFDHRDREDG